MVAQHYRWDFIGLSTDEKPTPQTSEKVVDGSTYYCSDNSKLYVFYGDAWYEKTVSGGGGASYTAGSGIDITDDTISVDTDTIQEKLTAGDNITIVDNVISASGGGGGPTVVQTTGTSTTDVMSQNATTGMVFADPNAKHNIQIGDGATSSNGSVAIGNNAKMSSGKNYGVVVGNNSAITYGNRGVAIGDGATCNNAGAVSLGSFSTANSVGEFNIGSSQVAFGYNNSNYRLLSGVYDGQSAHDAATKGQLDGVVLTNAGAPTTSTVGTVGQLLEDTTNGKLYICTDATNPYVWEEVGSGGGGGSAMVELTSADYNYHSAGSTDDGVALWLLPAGEYYIASNTNYYIKATSKITTNMDGTLFKIWKTSSGSSDILVIGPGVNIAGFYKISSTGTQIDYGYYLTDGAVTQSTGTSTALVMSQNAATNLVYGGLGAGVGKAIKIGSTTTTSSTGDRIAVSYAANASGDRGIAIGRGATASGTGAIALGTGSTASATGEMNIGASNASYGYNSSNYRLLSGLYDGQSNHDAATLAQGNKLMTTAPTTSDSGVLGQLWTDTTNMHTYQCTAISGDTYTWTQRW